MITETRYTFVADNRESTSDADLVQACRRGDANAWNVLVNRYQRLIYTIPRRAGLDEDQSAEVFQRTFARLMEHLDRIRQPDCIHAWLVTTARRETLQLVRQQSTEQSFSYAYSGDPGGRHNSETIPDDKPLPNEELEQLEEQHIIRRAVETMDDRCRCLLNLLYSHTDPPSYSEIAAALAMPEGSLGPTRARCLEKLRRLLMDSGI